MFKIQNQTQNGTQTNLHKLRRMSISMSSDSLTTNRMSQLSCLAFVHCKFGDSVLRGRFWIEIPGLGSGPSQSRLGPISKQ